MFHLNAVRKLTCQWKRSSGLAGPAQRPLRRNQRNMLIKHVCDIIANSETPAPALHEVGGSFCRSFSSCIATMLRIKHVDGSEVAPDQSPGTNLPRCQADYPSDADLLIP